MHLLIIGGSDAGISAALRVHELAPDIDITIVLTDDYPNFSICGLPYYLSGETPDWHALAHRTEFGGINVLRRHTAESIDSRAKAVVVEHAGTRRIVRYDRLVVATGATPLLPDLPGSNLGGVFLLHTMDDSFKLHQHLVELKPKTAVIIGGGYIGLEMADALTRRGISVTLLSRAETVLPTIDRELGRLVEDELRRHGVSTVTSVSARSIEQLSHNPRLSVTDSGGTRYVCDLVILGVGVRPNSALAREAGATLGAGDAIAVTRRMQTNLPDIFAAGDCVETYHHLLGGATYISLGTIAHKQGRIAGENAIGGDREFGGALGTQSIKAFDLAIARTGLLDHEAEKARFKPLTVSTETNDHKAYYPGAVSLHIRMTGDLATARLLGAQDSGSSKGRDLEADRHRCRGNLSGCRCRTTQRSGFELHASIQQSLGSGPIGGAGLVRIAPGISHAYAQRNYTTSRSRQRRERITRRPVLHSIPLRFLSSQVDFRHRFYYYRNMEKSFILSALAALSQESRLDVFRLLVEHGPEGLSAGAIAERLGLANATLSFHLKELAHAKLITARQAGRFIYYSANFATMNGLVAYLTENCCRGTTCDIACAPAIQRKRRIR